MSLNVFGIIEDLTHGRRKPEELSDVERRAILDTRRLDSLPPADDLKRAVKKWQVAALNLDFESLARTHGATGTMQAALPDWSDYVYHGHAVQTQRKKKRSAAVLSDVKTR